MMGLSPADLPAVFADLPEPPLAMGANCGVGASDLLYSLRADDRGEPGHRLHRQVECGIPQFVGEHIHYSGTPELMADYARLAIDAGARIVGGCCGTTFEHIAAMRAAIDAACARTAVPTARQSRRASGRWSTRRRRAARASVAAAAGRLARRTPS